MAQAVAAAAVAAGIGMTVVGGVTEAKGQLRASKDRAASLRYQAEQVEEEGVDRIVDLERERNAVAGAQRAAFGASGVKVNVGSPLAVQAETQYRADIQRERITRATQAQAAILRTNATSEERLGGARYRSTLLTTFGNVLLMGGRAGLAAGAGGGQ